ncbi:hypothetical protein GCM10025789_31280 [Tessaracoccus lubricantis]|uniref:Ribbon-helix-helix protein CopG domain-containing protein n=1 Tax=Tessaracoccus lubricantis TaxID=545543 RepID=A0ABP9FX50_9ACTN
MSGYTYPARARLSRPEDVEDLGALPDFLKARPAEKRPEAVSTPAEANPVRGLARKKKTPPAAVEETASDPIPAAPGPVVEENRRERARRKDERDLHRPSSANLPVALVAAIAKRRERTGMSAGDMIVAAIEQHMDQLPSLFGTGEEQEAQHASGFSARPKKSPVVDEITKLFPFRLTQPDFDYLDQLVDKFGARDRTHLIREALTQYIKD